MLTVRMVRGLVISKNYGKKYQNNRNSREKSAMEALHIKSGSSMSFQFSDNLTLF